MVYSLRNLTTKTTTAINYSAPHTPSQALCQGSSDPWSPWISSTSREIRVPTPTGTWRKRISDMLPNQLVKGWVLPINISPTQIFYSAWNASIMPSFNWFIEYASECWGLEWGLSQTRPCLHGANLLVGAIDHASGSQHSKTQGPVCNSDLLSGSFIILKLKLHIIHSTCSHNLNNDIAFSLSYNGEIKGKQF